MSEQEWLKQAYDRFYATKEGCDYDELDKLADALGDYLKYIHKTEGYAGPKIHPNRVCAMLAAEVLTQWEKAELNRP